MTHQGMRRHAKYTCQQNTKKAHMKIIHYLKKAEKKRMEAFIETVDDRKHVKSMSSLKPGYKNTAFESKKPPFGWGFVSCPSPCLKVWCAWYPQNNNPSLALWYSLSVYRDSWFWWYSTFMLGEGDPSHVFWYGLCRRCPPHVDRTDALCLKCWCS